MSNDVELDRTRIMKHVFYVVFLAFHVVFHPLLEAEEVNGDIMVGGHSHTC
jgi:hypothetical protein